MEDAPGIDEDILESKRSATVYRILVQIAERQPAVSQQEIADEIGVTAQAVSDYLQELVAAGYVETEGRGRYEVTKEGVDWLISRTDTLREYVEHVSGEILEDLEVETAMATGDITDGQTVSLSMREGILHASPTGAGAATAVAITDAEAGQEVGVTNFEGVIEHDLGSVTVISVPPVQEGGSEVLERPRVQSLAAEHDIVAVEGPSGLAALRTIDREPDVRFGSVAAVEEAAMKGLDVLVLAARSAVSTHTDALRERAVSYEVIDPLAER